MKCRSDVKCKTKSAKRHTYRGLGCRVSVRCASKNSLWPGCNYLQHASDWQHRRGRFIRRFTPYLNWPQHKRQQRFIRFAVRITSIVHPPCGKTLLEIVFRLTLSRRFRAAVLLTALCGASLAATGFDAIGVRILRKTFLRTSIYFSHGLRA